MEIKSRKSITDDLSKYDYLINKDSHEWIEITEWANGEGWDISTSNKHFSISIGELEAINYLTKALDYSEKQ